MALAMLLLEQMMRMVVGRLLEVVVVDLVYQFKLNAQDVVFLDHRAHVDLMVCPENRVCQVLPANQGIQVFRQIKHAQL